MKSLLVLLVLMGKVAAANEPVAVILNAAEYTDVVKNYFDDKRVPYQMIAMVPETNFVAITIAQDYSRGASCSVHVKATVDSMTFEGTSTKSNSGVSKKKKLDFCKKFVTQSLAESLSWFF